MAHSATPTTRLGAELKARILPRRVAAAPAPHKSSRFCLEQGGENRWSSLPLSPVSLGFIGEEHPARPLEDIPWVHMRGLASSCLFYVRVVVVFLLFLPHSLHLLLSPPSSTMNKDLPHILVSQVSDPNNKRFRRRSRGLAAPSASSIYEKRSPLVAEVSYSDR